MNNSQKHFQQYLIKLFINRSEQMCREGKLNLKAFRVEGYADTTAFNLNICTFSVDVSVDGNGRDQLILSILRDVKKYCISALIDDRVLTPKDFNIEL